MNAHQRRVDRRRIARKAKACVPAAILQAHEDLRASISADHGRALKAGLEAHFRSMLPDDLKQYTPTVEWL